MATLIVNLENNFDTDQILSAISAIQGVKEVFIKPKTKTAELLERIERGEYVSDDEYFASIPGFYEELDRDFEEGLKEGFIPIEEVWADWNDL